MIDKDLIITQQDLVDWIDRPPSNDDLDLCNYLSNAVKNQYEYHKEIERLNNIIDELEKYLKEQNDEHYSWHYREWIRQVLDKLNELKGDNK